MTFTEACIKARKQGGGYVFGYGNAKYEVTEEGNVINRAKDGHYNLSGSGWKVSPKDPLVLMNFVTACSHAAKIGGGIVTCGEGIEIVVNSDGAIDRPVRYALDYQSKIWRVQPADMSFDEAWECLKRGESVIGVEDRWAVQPRLLTEVNSYYKIEDLKHKRFRPVKDKRFRKAQQ